MRFSHPTLAALAATVALALPGFAQSDSMYHLANSGIGFTYHPEHFKSTKSRAEVIAEVEAARKDGTLALIQQGVPLPMKSTAPAKTRQQVIDEMRNEPPEQRRARMEMMVGG